MINIFEITRSLILSLMRKVREKTTIGPEFKRAVRLWFADFCKYNTLHGVRYFTVPVRHWTERLWWAIAVALALCLSIWMIYPFWVEWKEYPTTMTTTDEKNAFLLMPFPTVIICPPTKIIRNKFDLSSKFDSKDQLLPNVSHTDKMRLFKLANVCPRLKKVLPYGNDFADEDIFNVIEDVAPNVGHVALSCSWNEAIFNCAEHLKPILTDFGVCFTFNALNSRDIYTDEMAPGAMITKGNPNVSHWTMEEGYENGFGKEEYPIRVTSSDQSATLEINLVLDKRNDDRLCPAKYPEFNVFLTQPYEPTALGGIDNFEATLFRDTHIQVASRLTTTSNGLRKYSPDQRECFFQSERQLRFYKINSYGNCARECMANFTKEYCGCVDILMPRDRETKICGATNINRLLKFLAEMDGYSVIAKCNCLPACTTTGYSSEIEQLPLNIKSGKQLNESQQPARLRITLQKSKVKTMQREERVTVVDFLAMCGGVLGLFMGFSVMTIVEYIYYPFLRLYCTIQRLKKEEEEEKEKEKSKEGANEDKKKKSADLGVRQSDSRKWKDRLKSYLLEYCDNSNIHGMRYFSLPDLQWSDRCYWAVCCIASFALCAWMTHNVWVQWQTSPVLIKPSKAKYDPLMIPLPTVTICPQVKTMKQKLDLTSALNHLSNLSHTETQRLNDLANVCPLLPNFVAFGDRFANESIYDTIQDIAPQFKDTLSECSFDGSTLQPCSRQIKSVLTDEGLCFAFNAQQMYTDEMAPGMKLIRHPTSVSAGFSSVFIIVSIDKRNFDYRCKHFDGAFKVTLTQPGEVLKMSRNYFQIRLGKLNTINYESKLTKVSEGLLSYKPDRRQCFHPLENPLRFFRTYTQANCEEECLANFTSVECGCVHFSMPRDIKTKVCGGASILCMKAAKRKLRTDESGLEFHSKCNCLPACASIEYKVDVQRISHRFPQDNRKEFAIVRLPLRNIESFERVERFTTIDFLAVCGGLFGECLGVSVLSIVEIIFFITLRLFFVIRSWIFENTAVHPTNQESVETVTENIAVQPNQASSRVVAIVHHV